MQDARRLYYPVMEKAACFGTSTAPRSRGHARKSGLSNLRVDAALEAQPRLELDHPPSQSPTRLAEMNIVNCGVAIASRKWNQIQFIENVEEISAEVQLSLFTLEKRYSRGLYEAHVDALVPWAAEGIAMDERRALRADIKVRRARAFTGHRIVALRRYHLNGVVRIRIRHQISLADEAWKIAVGRLKGIVAVIATSFARVRCRQRRAERASVRDWRAIEAL